MYKIQLLIRFQWRKVIQVVFLSVLVGLFSGCSDKDRQVKFEDYGDGAKEQDREGGEKQEATEADNEKKEPAAVFVYVCGAVNKPGVYEVQNGSRVFELVELAGGFTEEAHQPAVNLAGIVVDGQQLLIPTREEAADGNWGGTGNGAPAEDGRINLNTADVKALSSLNGIGESKAQAIVQYREEQGLFQSIDELKKVNGIGEKTYDKIKEDITVD